MFDQLLITANTTTKASLVLTVLESDTSWHYSPGAKNIDVFPATFAGLNGIYWSYYLAKSMPKMQLKLLSTRRKLIAKKRSYINPVH